MKLDLKKQLVKKWYKSKGFIIGGSIASFTVVSTAVIVPVALSFADKNNINDNLETDFLNQNANKVIDGYFKSLNILEDRLTIRGFTTIKTLEDWQDFVKNSFVYQQNANLNSFSIALNESYPEEVYDRWGTFAPVYSLDKTFGVFPNDYTLIEDVGYDTWDTFGTFYVNKKDKNNSPDLNKADFLSSVSFSFIPELIKNIEIQFNNNESKIIFDFNTLEKYSNRRHTNKMWVILHDDKNNKTEYYLDFKRFTLSSKYFPSLQTYLSSLVF